MDKDKMKLAMVEAVEGAIASKGSSLLVMPEGMVHMEWREHPAHSRYTTTVRILEDDMELEADQGIHEIATHLDELEPE